ncbi:VanZ family protein [Vibrio japonicus]|uniref:VanZ family protein n=1 Tax=Vibrio japonicus TaxID=1824638 RepID=A0ABY5LQE5_9VIBR|nr:VanZ family protein [Vibrio japonicus]UUM32992.1 VanZ family protein [Vibrio japonicus]
MSASFPSDFFNKRLCLLMCAIGLVSVASLAKSLGRYEYAVLDVEDWLGGAWALHTCVSISLGFIASWATPKRYLQQATLPISPWIWMLLVIVTFDEITQFFNSNRHFSLLDLSINISGVIIGALFYLAYFRMRYSR